MVASRFTGGRFKTALTDDESGWSFDVVVVEDADGDDVVVVVVVVEGDEVVLLPNTTGPFVVELLAELVSC